MREVEKSPWAYNKNHSKNCYSQIPLMGAKNQWMKVWGEIEYL